MLAISVLAMLFWSSITSILSSILVALQRVRGVARIADVESDTMSCSTINIRPAPTANYANLLAAQRTKLFSTHWPQGSRKPAVAVTNHESKLERLLAEPQYASRRQALQQLNREHRPTQIGVCRRDFKIRPSIRRIDVLPSLKLAHARAEFERNPGDKPKRVPKLHVRRVLADFAPRSHLNQLVESAVSASLDLAKRRIDAPYQLPRGSPLVHASTLRLIPRCVVSTEEDEPDMFSDYTADMELQKDGTGVFCQPLSPSRQNGQKLHLMPISKGSPYTPRMVLAEKENERL